MHLPLPLKQSTMYSHLALALLLASETIEGKLVHEISMTYRRPNSSIGSIISLTTELKRTSIN